MDTLGESDVSTWMNLTPYNYVSFRSENPVMPLALGAKLGVPVTGQRRIPAAVIAHGSSGVDSRGMFYANLLDCIGIATLEIDMFTERGYGGGAGGRPRSVPEPLPDARGALRLLGSDSRIDPARIGIMGFSWGGVVSMLTATTPYTRQLAPAGLQFAVHAPFYPVCWGYNKVPGYEFAELTGAPVFIQAGEIDTYDDPDSATQLVQGLTEAQQQHVTCQIHPNATHAWDRMEPVITVNDPFACKGLGGPVDFTPNPAVRLLSGQATVDFFPPHLWGLIG